MIVLFNFNSYLGGGETLFVRMANYLEKKREDYFLFFLKGGYIEKDLERTGIPKQKCHAIVQGVDYYYLRTSERDSLLDEIKNVLPKREVYYLVSFCSRDLYTVCALNNRCDRFRIGHLILHDQDNLYLCQTLFDKFLFKYFNKRRFSSKRMIAFNIKLYTELSEKYSLVPQSDIQVKLWGQRYGIPLDYEKVVPLPTYDFSTSKDPIITDRTEEKKIIWIGRFVDFKLPALCAMLNFVSNHADYSLTIVGKGDEKFVKNYISQNNIDTNRVSFIGEIPYGELGEIIRKHTVGYAMGTSIVEIGKYGVPVIMALGSPSAHIFKYDICGGVYFDVDKGNVGDNLYYDNNEDLQPRIEDAIEIIQNDYVNVSNKCYNFMKESFDLSKNIDLYIKFLTQERGHFKIESSLPKCSQLRRFLYYKIK